MSTDAPTAEISEDMPEFLIQRLENIAKTQPHFEASFGGPHNAMLQTYFPLKHSFMIKPIARIRPSLDIGEMLDDDEISMASPHSNESSPEGKQSPPPARISIDFNPPVESNRRSMDSNRPRQSHRSNDSASDSMSVDIESHSDDDDGSYRPSEHSEASDTDSMATPISHDSYDRPVPRSNAHSCPDFLVVKATGALNNDQPLLIWELKRNADDHEKSIIQRNRYERWARDYQQFCLQRENAVPSISVALIEHNTVTIRTFDRNGVMKEATLKVLSNGLNTLLRKIARNNA